MQIHTIDREEMPLRQHFFVAGAICRVSTNSPAIMNALWQWRCSHDAAGVRSFNLDVRVGSLGDRTDHGTPHFRGRDHLVFATFSDRDLFVFDLCRRSVVGFVSKQTAEDRRFWTTLLIPIALGVLGPAIGLVPVHAACLDWNGKGLMIAGASGAGKSTLAVALSQRGFSLLSDDWTYVAQEGPSVTAYGISAPVKLLADAPLFFPELSRFEPAKSLNGEMAFEVDAGWTFGSPVQSQSNPSWLVLLERVAQTGCEMARLVGDNMWTFFERNLERLPATLAETDVRRSETIAELTKKDCWLLRYGGPPQIAAEALRQFCEGM